MSTHPTRGAARTDEAADEAAPAARVPAPRSLADDLRRRSDAELEALLRDRPDLTTPVPADVGALAVRSGTPASVSRALDTLDRFSLDVVDALCVLPDPTSGTAVAGLVGVERTVVDLVLERLRLLGLWWGTADELHLLRTVRDVVGPYPAGLGPPAPFAHAKDVVAALDGAPDEARELVERLAADGPVGQVADARRTVTVDSARTPVEWLLARGVLVPVDDDSVALVREVGLHLRGGLVRATPATRPPTPAGTEHEPGRVGAAAAQHAFELIRKLAELLEIWAVEPPAVLRTGGVGVRDVTATAGRLDLDVERTTLLIELAYAAGLVADSHDEDPAWLPTPVYDAWLEMESAQRWTAVATAWLSSPRVHALAGSRDDRGNRVPPLGKELERGHAVPLRTAALEELAAAPPGTGLDADEVLAVLHWRRPRQADPARDDAVRSALAEAEALGVTGLRAMSRHGRALLTGDERLATDELEDALPPTVDHVLLQADLTAVAPGPLAPDLAREMALLADVESTGGATVYRFSEASIRRGLDGGRDAAAVQEFLERASLTPVPQPLSYMVDDVARRHGALRVGVAGAYVRCDDETVVAELLADRRAASLQLRRLAPTVVAAQSPVDVVLDRLRELGYAPAAESAEGDVVALRQEARRTPARRRGVRPSPHATTASTSAAAAAVRTIRAGEGAPAARAAAPGLTGPPPAGLTGASSADVLAALRAAAGDGATAWVGLTDRQGATAEHVVDVLQVEGGFLTAYDHGAGAVRTVPVHRVTGVVPVEPDRPAADGSAE